MKRTYLLTLPILMAACTPQTKLGEAQYWQRKDATSAIYMQGPKAQQALHQDISNCTANVNELYRLGTLREAVPRPLETPDESVLARHDTPQKDGFLGAEHFDYTDFETCMRHHGWERVENLPYTVSVKARQDWRRIVEGEKELGPETNLSKPTPKDRDPFDDLNN